MTNLNFETLTRVAVKFVSDWFDFLSVDILVAVVVVVVLFFNDDAEENDLRAESERKQRNAW